MALPQPVTFAGVGDRKPGPIARRAVSDAIKNIGVTEVGNNSGKYIRIYQQSPDGTAHDGKPGDPWCAFFTDYREKAADAAIVANDLPADWPDSGYCPDYKNWAQKRGLWIAVADASAGRVMAQVGDLVLFYFADKRRVAHIGIVIEVHSWGVVSVEGNTGPEHGAAVVREGDGVYRKVRNWSELGAFGGFVRLPW